MKRIHELTELELLALTDTEVIKYIDYECALEGVPMLPPHPGPAPDKLTATPDVTMYTVAGQNTLDSEHATRILQACNSGTLLDTANARNDYSVTFVTPQTDRSYSAPKIETKQVHSPEQWDRIKNDYTNYADRKSEWDTHDRIYRDALKERASISDDVYDRISQARQHSYQRDNLRNEFTRYLELAEGNRQIALNFLEKVKDLSDFPELRQEFCPITDVAKEEL